MATYNLLTTRWIPVRQGAAEIDISPWLITQDLATNPITAVMAPRPDFTSALYQLLIGLLQTAFAPEDLTEWYERWESPPTPEELQNAFEPFAHAFELDGEGPRFMQDLDPLSGQAPLPVTALLIDAAGSETHFFKGLPDQGFSPAVAAMALYTLQINAPSGGVGHRTSLRGGGPLTTLVMARPRDPGGDPIPSLWQTLWLNVLPRSAIRGGGYPPEPEQVFPWLTVTRTSEKGRADTTPQAVHPLQMFWGMPRRIRLDLDNLKPGTCALGGQPAEGLIRTYRTKNYGTNYTGAWQHSLTPYTNDGSGPAAVHPRGKIGYRHWLGVMQEDREAKVRRVPAQVVRRFKALDELHDDDWSAGVWACGYDMDNMKPRRWVEATLPLFHIKDAKRRDSVELLARQLVQAADLFSNNLRNCLKDAWFSEGDPRRKKAELGMVQDAFWQETEALFYRRLDALLAADDLSVADRAIAKGWHTDLKGYTEGAFDRWVDYNQLSEQSHPKRIAEARRRLRKTNNGPGIRKALDLPEKPKNDAAI